MRCQIAACLSIKRCPRAILSVHQQSQIPTELDELCSALCGMALTQDSWRLSSDWQLGGQTKETISNDRHLRTIHSYIFILKPVSQSHIKEWQNRENDWQAHEARMNKHLPVLDHAHKDTHVKFVILNNFLSIMVSAFELGWHLALQAKVIFYHTIMLPLNTRWIKSANNPRLCCKLVYKFFFILVNDGDPFVE